MSRGLNLKGQMENYAYNPGCLNHKAVSKQQQPWHSPVASKVHCYHILVIDYRISEQTSTQQWF